MPRQQAEELPSKAEAPLFASPAESVGGLWFGKSSKRLKQSHFHGFIKFESQGSSGNHSYLVVEALDGAA
jgi:hypothetical protein